MQRSDLELLEAWRGGDLSAGNELFHRHFDAVCRFFANKVHEDVDDLIQRTFLGCVEGRERLRGDTGFRGYLFGVARNVLRRYFRDKRYFRERFAGLEISAEDVAPGPSLLLAEKREQQLLLRALRALPLDHQITLELYYWESLSGRELAEILEVPEGTVRGRIRRAKELLQEKLTELAASPEHLQTTLANLESWARSLREQAVRRGLDVHTGSTPGEPS
ncbi:MAG: sigma-70 family RNA polymerase sigma factor [Myxococcales bacterium FL481]|nr:MAG: sigma-70 family RNA polymerase sigma factor [Myxococcales bacterium FL481]